MIEIENADRPMTLEEALSKETVGITEIGVISANLQFVSKADAKRLGLLKEWGKVHGEEDDAESDAGEDVPTTPKAKKGK